MLFLAIVATVLSALWTFFVLFANGMSSAPSVPLQGGWMIGGAWLVTAVLYTAWWLG